MKKLSTRRQAEPGTESIMCVRGYQRAGPAARSAAPEAFLQQLTSRRGGVRRSMRGSAARESHLTYT
jgi:hypothetical protein